MNTHLPIDTLDLSFISWKSLTMAGINTLGDLWALLDEGIDLRRIRNMRQKDIAEILTKAQDLGYPSHEAVAQHIENTRCTQRNDSDCIQFWEDLYESLISNKSEMQTVLYATTLASLDDMPDYYLSILKEDGIRTVGELFARHKSEDTLPFIFLLAPAFVRILYNNGYRFPDCPKEKWPDIEDYILFKKALRYSIDRLCLPQETKEILKTAGITIATIVNENYAFLADYLNNAQIAQLLFALDDFDLRTKDTRKKACSDIVSFVVKNIEIPVADLGLSPHIYSCLHEQSIDTLSNLLEFSRRELIGKKIVHITAIPEIVCALHNYRVHLKRDAIYECTCCKTPIVAPENNNEIHFCFDCANRINRIQQVKEYVVTLNGPDYDSYTDGTEGFTIFATLHNKTNNLVEVKLVEFMLYHDDRQWAPSKNLTGYNFNSEYILPKSSKTSAKIWSGIEWEDKQLLSGDYISLSFSIEDKIYSYKFVLKNDKFEIDDYFAY